MCGFCTEGTTIELAKALTKGTTWPSKLEKFFSFDFAYLQECPDILSSLARVKPQLIEATTQLQAEDIKNFNNGDVVYLVLAFCRFVEILMKHGFDSEIYQHLVTTPFIADVIIAHNQLFAVLDEQSFGMDAILRNVFQDEFFFNSEKHRQILNNSKLIRACETCLNNYVDWWHFDKEWQGSEQSGDELVNDLVAFRIIYTHVFFSYIMVETYNPGQVIARLVQKMPGFAGATMENLDFWLQRKAALVLYDMAGIRSFWPFTDGPRSPLTYYLLVKDKLSTEDKQALQDVLMQSANYDAEKVRFWSKEPRNVSTDTEYFIMNYLENASSQIYNG